MTYPPKSKYRPGKKITSLNMLVKQTVVWHRYWGKAKSIHFFINWQAAILLRCIQSGLLFVAIPKPVKPNINSKINS